MAQTRSKYGLLGRLNLEDLYNTFLGMNQRQQTLVMVGLVLLVILILVLPISYASSKLSGLSKQYKSIRDDRANLISEISGYQLAQKKLEKIKEQLKASGGARSLTTVMESLANNAGVGSEVTLKPLKKSSADYYDEEEVEATLQNVNLTQVIGFLVEIENYGQMPLRIKSLDIKPHQTQREQLRTVIRVSTIKYAGK